MNPQHPGVRPHGPDLMVILGVREQKAWSTFDVAAANDNYECGQDKRNKPERNRRVQPMILPIYESVNLRAFSTRACI